MARLTIAQLSAELAAERHNNELLRTQVARLEAELAATAKPAAPVRTGGNTAYREYLARARAVSMEKRCVVRVKPFAEWVRNPND